MPVIRILQILSDINRDSGTTTLVVNWHKNIDRGKIQFDYLYCSQSKDLNFEEEIKKLGGRVYKLPYPSLLKPWIFIKALIVFFKNHKYKILHSHITQLNFFYFPVAKFYGAKNIIVHSHSTIYSSNPYKSFINRMMFYCSKKFINYKMAISKKAGDFLFGKKSDYIVMHNGIDTNVFSFDEQERDTKRSELQIKDKFVIGHVGRFAKEKNHLFMIDILKEIGKYNKNAVLILSGNGYLEKHIRHKAEELFLNDKILFTGVTANIQSLYQAMDVFLFPSLNEGFGLALIEAQCAGLPCFISDSIPAESNITNTTVIPLSHAPAKWAEIIVKGTLDFKRKNESDAIKERGFHITDIAKQIQNFYLDTEEKC